MCIRPALNGLCKMGHLSTFNIFKAPHMETVEVVKRAPFPPETAFVCLVKLKVNVDHDLDSVT